SLSNGCQKSFLEWVN
ncbi:hypothetical protein CFOL_v3_27503, partial [Cephalotus follicularis]